MHPITEHTGPEPGTAVDPFQAQVDRELAAHFEGLERDATFERWRERYLAEGLVRVREICPRGVWAHFAAEAQSLLDSYSVRQDIHVATTGGSPRRLMSVRRSYINRYGRLIPALYRSSVLRRFLANITQEPILICPYEDEQFVISLLSQPGDTHGWHWDDYRFGLVWIVESPPPELGGFVQCVAGTEWNKNDPQLCRAFIEKPIRSYAFDPGDLYFIRPDTTLHRVYPLQGSSRRVIVNMAWAGTADLGRTITHETTEAIYTDRPEIMSAL
ncbi:MAG TPA: hypothetical protein VEI03_19760 [Stellaceae bacterium]|nr:hypothetical protein [Stellaceae bacterium]